MDPAYYDMMRFSCPCKCAPLSVHTCCSFLLKFEFPHPVLWLVDSSLPIYVLRHSSVATSSLKLSLTLKVRFRGYHHFLCIRCPDCNHYRTSVEPCEVLIKHLWRKGPAMYKQREMGKYKSHSGTAVLSCPDRSHIPPCWKDTVIRGLANPWGTSPGRLRSLRACGFHSCSFRPGINI